MIRYTVAIAFGAASFATAFCALGEETGHRPPKRFAPTAEAGATFVEDRVLIESGGREVQEGAQPIWQGRLGLGVAWDVTRLAPQTILTGQSSVTVGLAFDPGDWLVCTRHTLGPGWSIASAVRLGIGLGLGACVDTEQAAQSYAEIPLPVSIRVAFMELSYAAVFVMPLGSESSAAFSGVRHEHVGARLVPFDLTVRFVVKELGW